ncbi:MAG: flippase-like domain-containing protein [Lentisphaerae bacterium]|nr:flippase-like domain-containing protein [Lentisphaerota bacterium]
MKKMLLSLIQLAIGIGLIVLICVNMKDKGDLLEAVRVAASHWLLIITGLMLFMICLVFVTYRWMLLLRAQGLRLSFPRAFALYFIGHFFNSFLFGTTGGDMVKAVYAAREMPAKRTEAVSTVFIDRIIGLLILVALSSVIMATRFRFFMSYQETKIAFLLNIGLLAGFVVGLFAAFRQNLFERWPLFRRLKENTAVGNIIAKVYNACHVCLLHPAILLKAAVFSILNQFTLVLSCICFGLALEIKLPFLDSITIYPIINAFAAVPLTPGGLGTRELAAKHLLGVLNVPDTRAVFLAWLIYGNILFWSLVGGVIYLVYVLVVGKADTNQTSNL